jgi:hypothetical protein
MTPDGKVTWSASVQASLMRSSGNTRRPPPIDTGNTISRSSSTSPFTSSVWTSVHDPAARMGPPSPTHMMTPTSRAARCGPLPQAEPDRPKRQGPRHFPSRSAAATGWAGTRGRGRLASPQPALVAQLERASDYGSEGWGFESLRARQPQTTSLSRSEAPHRTRAGPSSLALTVRSGTLTATSTATQQRDALLGAGGPCHAVRSGGGGSSRPRRPRSTCVGPTTGSSTSATSGNVRCRRK